jgi:hypothetical protein
MSDVLREIRLKIGRAAKHSEWAQAIAEEFMRSNFYRIEMISEGKRCFIFKVTAAKPIPTEFGIVVGEAAHQLRSCLDHLIFPLAKPATIKKQKLVQFPIARRRQDFQNQVGTNLPGVPRGIRTLVESLQPYHRRKWPETALLGQLKAIDDWDKHRMVMASAVAIEGSTMNFINESGVIIEHQTFLGILKPDTVIARVELKDAPAGTQVKMQPEFEIRPIFSKRMPKEIRMIPAVPFIKTAGEFLRDTILPKFERFF